MFKPTILEFSPSEELAHVDIGQVFTYNDKEYLLVGRDPWVADVIRLTWWTELRIRGFKYFFEIKKRRNKKTS